jgi:hypothetical protein
MTAALAARWERYKAIEGSADAFFVWNRVYLRNALCSSESNSFSLYDDFFVFDPQTPTPFPAYRHLSSANPPGWFPPNRFGWRGPDVTLNKPADTIRIAFVGSSKTIDNYSAPFSHIEYVGEWLNLWMRANGYPYRVEVINAARTGIDEASIAGIVQQELLPLEPDLVIDDGGNGFAPALLLDPSGQGLAKPPKQDAVRWPAETYSALVRRVRTAFDRARIADGTEPAKPSYAIQWPADVDEFHPDVTHTPLPMNLHVLVGHYDAMRTPLQAAGGVFALSSWVWMVRDGLQLDRSRDLVLYNSLNWTYYPVTYSQMRRAADFQNRVLRAYTERYGLPFFDLAAVSPLDPELFGDAVHMTPQGLRLQAWIYLQLIASWIEHQIESRRLPRKMQHPQDRHPAFVSTDYPFVTKATMLETCH